VRVRGGNNRPAVLLDELVTPFDTSNPNLAAAVAESNLSSLGDTY
jgi:hypothetical protein